MFKIQLIYVRSLITKHYNLAVRQTNSRSILYSSTPKGVATKVVYNLTLTLKFRQYILYYALSREAIINSEQRRYQGLQVGLKEGVYIPYRVYQQARGGDIDINALLLRIGLRLLKAYYYIVQRRAKVDVATSNITYQLYY